MNECKAVFAQVFRFSGLHADIEEADAVLELFSGRDGLAADGREGAMAGGRVVGAGDGEGGEGGLVFQFEHP